MYVSATTGTNQLDAATTDRYEARFTGARGWEVGFLTTRGWEVGFVTTRG